VGDDLRLRTDGQTDVFVGQIIDEGATPGDVLTVQSDGSLAAEAGGSQPNVTDGTTTIDAPALIEISGATLTGDSTEAVFTLPGAVIPDSWLLAEVDGSLTASGNLPWNTLGSAGDDVSVDGDDDTLIDIATPGTYEIALWCSFAGDGTSNGSAFANLAGSILGQDWLADIDDNIEIGAMIGVNALYSLCLTAPPIQVAAPCTVQITVTITTTAGTQTVGGRSGQILVRRIA